MIRSSWPRPQKAWCANSKRPQASPPRASLTVKVLDKDAIDEAGMGGVIGVSKGSQTDPVFIELAWQGADASKAPVVLVGKGVTV